MVRFTRGSHAISRRVPFFEVLDQVGVDQFDAVYLVPQRDPVGLDVVGAPKQLDLPRPRRQPLDHSVDFVRFVAGGAHLGHDHVRIEPPVEILRIAFHSDEAVLFAVVQPMARPPRADDALQLVGLDPDDLVDALVAPQFEALAPEFHGSARHPQEDETLVLQLGDSQLPHLVVRHGAVGELHVDVPRGVRHDHGEFACNRSRLSVWRLEDGENKPNTVMSR
jgi:hypothetical protein